MPDIFGYGDYRKFIRDYYLERKARESGFSLQVFAEHAGFSTKTFLHKVMNGEKAISRDSIVNVARAMELKKQETGYFEALVNFNEGKTVVEREYFFNRLQAFKYTHPQLRLKANQFAYFSKWYHAVIRELITLHDFRDDYNSLSRSLVPPIRPAQARSAVAFLLKMGLIERLPSGAYRQTDRNLTTGDEVVSLAVQRFQKDTIGLGAEAIDRVPGKARDISALTMGVSEEGFLRIKQDLRKYRKHIIELVNEDTAADRVYQLNIQFFPLARPPKKRRTP